MSATVLLQQFARFPRLGAVKRRLASDVGDAQAFAVHCELMGVTTRSLLDAGIGTVELWVDEPGQHAVISHCLDAGASGPRLQRGADLGERMAYALRDGLQRAGRVLLVGSDCPGLDPALLRSAAAALDEVSVVFAPADDGGFVLVGARVAPPGLFTSLQWGEGAVLARCEKQLQALGLSTARLATRFDIDTVEDLRRWRAASPASGVGCDGA